MNDEKDRRIEQLSKGKRNLGNLNVCPREQEGWDGGSDCSGVTGCRTDKNKG